MGISIATEDLEEKVFEKLNGSYTFDTPDCTHTEKTKLMAKCDVLEEEIKNYFADVPPPEEKRKSLEELYKLWDELCEYPKEPLPKEKEVVKIFMSELIQVLNS